MNKIILLVVFGLSLVNRIAAQQVIPISFSPEGHIMIKAAFNGVEGDFILDTGAGLNVLTSKYASELKSITQLDTDFTGFRATGERLDLDLYKTGQLTIGTYSQTSSMVSVIDANFGPLDGLISLMPFLDQPFTIDFTKSQLILETDKSLSKRKKSGFITPLQLHKAREKSIDAFANLVVNNKLTLQFLLDSGAGNNVFKINAKHSLSLGLDTTNTVKSYKGSEFNQSIKTTSYKSTINQLAFIDQPAINKENINAIMVSSLIYDGVVSINWIGDLITFDLKNSEMIVQRKSSNNVNAN